MVIGEAARRAGLSAKAIRYYERVGLIAPSGRRDNGYRDFDDTDVHRLRFVKQARHLGFTVEECGELLALYDDRDRASADVKRMTLARIDDIDRRIAELRDMQATLRRLADRCHGDDRPDCPILDGLSGKACGQ